MNYTEAWNHINKTEHEQNDTFFPMTDLDILGPVTFYLLETMLGIMGFLAVFANVLTMVTIFKYQLLWRKNACRYITCLAISDLLMGLGAFTSIIIDNISMSSSHVYNIVCKIKLFVSMMGSLGNFYTFLFLSVDRFLYVHMPLQYGSLVTGRRVVKSIVFIWVVSIIEVCSGIVWEPKKESQLCQILNEDVYHKIGMYLMIFQAYIVTIFVLVPGYGKIVYTTKKLMANEPHPSNLTGAAQAEQRQKQRERSLTLGVSLVFSVYVLCFIPISTFIAVLSQFFSSPLPFGVVLGRRILVLLHRVQSIIDPFLYGLKSSMMKTGYKKLLFRRSTPQNSFEMN